MELTYKMALPQIETKKDNSKMLNSPFYKQKGR